MRFIIDRRHFKLSTGEVKYASFERGTDGKVSVYRISGLDEPSTWDLAITQAATRADRLKAIGLLTVQAVTVANLEVEADPLSHIRHANLVGWAAAREDQLAQAVALAKAATLRVRPEAGRVTR